jgi:hypothetical protein
MACSHVLRFTPRPTTTPCRLLFSLLLYRLTSYWNFLAFRCMIVELFRSHTCKESPNG